MKVEGVVLELPVSNTVILLTVSARACQFFRTVFRLSSDLGTSGFDDNGTPTDWPQRDRPWQ